MSWLSKATGIHVHKWHVTTDPGSIGGALSSLGTGVVNIVRNPFSSQGWREISKGAPQVATAAAVTAAGLYAFSGPGAAASPATKMLSGTEIEAASGAGQGPWVEPGATGFDLEAVAGSGQGDWFEPSIPASPTGMELEAASGSMQGEWVEPAVSKAWYSPALPYAEKIGVPLALKMLAPTNAPAAGPSQGLTIFNMREGGSAGGPSGSGGGGSWSDYLSQPSIGGLPLWATYLVAFATVYAAIAASRKR